MDGSLARGFVRQEAREIQKGLSEIETGLRECILKHAGKSLLAGRRMTADSLSRMADEIDALVAAGLVVLRKERLSRPATISRPKGDAHELLYAYLAPAHPSQATGEGCYQLATMRILVSRKRLEADLRLQPLAFVQHAPKRLLERDGVESRAHAALGKALAEHAALFVWMTNVVMQPGRPVSLAIPCEDGIAMGTAALAPTEDTASRQALGASGWRMEELPPNTAFSPPRLAGDGMRACFTVKTFVDEKKLAQRQADLRQALLDWEDEHSAVIGAVTDYVLWPESDMLSGRRASDDRASLSDRLKAATNDLRRILGNESAMIAMGNGTRPLNEAREAMMEGPRHLHAEERHPEATCSF
jgi:hypothetical protein